MFVMDKMDVESNTSCLLYCKEVTKDEPVLGNKGMKTLIEASIARTDNLNAKITERMTYHIHTKFYKEYTKKENIISYLKKDNQKPETYRGELQERRPFDYPTHCLICSQELDFEKAEKYPEDKSYQISEVEMVDSKKKSTLQESLLQMCEGRTDEVALNLKARIIFAGHIRAVETKYHLQCY